MGVCREGKLCISALMEGWRFSEWKIASSLALLKSMRNPHNRENGNFALLTPCRQTIFQHAEHTKGSDITTLRVQKVPCTERKNSNIAELQTELRSPAGLRRLGPAVTRLSVSPQVRVSSFSD